MQSYAQNVQFHLPCLTTSATLCIYTKQSRTDSERGVSILTLAFTQSSENYAMHFNAYFSFYLLDEHSLLTSFVYPILPFAGYDALRQTVNLTFIHSLQLL